MSERLAVISDLHFGDPAGGDLLTHSWIRKRLFKALQEGRIDRLVILGDLFELIFAPFDRALLSSQPFFKELQAAMPELRIMWIPGNHDYHVVSQAADEHRLRDALGYENHTPFRLPVAERLLAELTSLSVSSAYPIWKWHGCVFHHGHYLSTHLDSLGWRSFDRLQWMLWGKPRNHHGLSAADYESLIAPLHELWYHIAQLPDGDKRQQNFEERLGKIGQVITMPTAAAGAIAARVRDRSVQNLAPEQPTLQALLQVVNNLDIIDESVHHFIFGHIHEPLYNISFPGGEHPHCKIHNCGSWLYDARTSHQVDYKQRAWPGTLLVLDEQAGNVSVSIQYLLADQDSESLMNITSSSPDPLWKRRFGWRDVLLRK